MKLALVLRSLLRQPSTTVVALLILALGIGATTAVFSVLYAVAFKPLPWPDADRIVQLGDTDPSLPETARQTVFQLGNVGPIRDELPAFDSAAGYMGHNMTLTGFDEPVRLNGANVSVDLFRVLGVSPLAGRTFDRNDERERREDLVMLSHKLAGRLFDDPASAVGQTVQLDGEAREVIGVMSSSFEFPDASAEYWFPLYPFVSDDPGEVREMMLPAIARLTPDTTAEAALTQGQGFLNERVALMQQRQSERRMRGPGGPGGGGQDGGRMVRRRAGPQSEAEAGGSEQGGVRVERRVGGGQAGPEMGEDSEGGADGGRVVVRRGSEPAAGGPEGPAGPGPEVEIATAHRPAEDAEQDTASEDETDGEVVVSEAPGGPGGPTVEAPSRTFVLTSLVAQRLAPMRDSLQLLIGAVLLVLLMACTNVANLLLARGAHREREMATRLSLGATRGNLVALLFAESLALAFVAGILGVGLAWAGVQLLRRLGPEALLDFSTVGLSVPVVLFAVGAAFFSTLLFGLLPALQASGARPGRALGRTGGNALGAIWRGKSRLGWLRSALTLGQVAMAIVLLAGAGLLANSFLRLVNVDPGYEARDLLTFRVAPPTARYQGEQRTQLYERMIDELESIPEVQSAAVVNFLPLFRGRIQISMMIEGQELPPDHDNLPTAEARVASKGYFETMKIALLRGRTFTEEDRADAEPVVVVNESFVKQILPNEPNPIGQRIAGMGEIVGVVGDVLLQGLDSEPGPTFYQPLAQMDPRMGMMFNRMSVAVRTDDPTALVPTVRARISALDSQLPIEDPLPMESRLSDSVATPRFFATVLGLFAAVALILAVTGVYGVLAFNASRRAKETGVRLALGAQRSSVVRRTLLEGVGLTAAGVVVGVALAIMLSRALASLLFGVEPGDLATLAVVSLVLLIAAALGSLVPALRAARVDPMVVLREE